MARKASKQNGSLETRTARRSLPVRGKPYYVKIGRGVHLGYRKNQGDARWGARVYVKDQAGYVTETFTDAAGEPLNG